MSLRCGSDGWLFCSEKHILDMGGESLPGALFVKHGMSPYMIIHLARFLCSMFLQWVYMFNGVNPSLKLFVFLHFNAWVIWMTLYGLHMKINVLERTLMHIFLHIQVYLAQGQWTAVCSFFASCHPEEDIDPSTFPYPKFLPFVPGDALSSTSIDLMQILSSAQSTAVWSIITIVRMGLTILSMRDHFWFYWFGLKNRSIKITISPLSSSPARSILLILDNLLLRCHTLCVLLIWRVGRWRLCSQHRPWK